MAVNVKDVTKNFGDQKALDRVSFEISTGEIAGFIGPNGSGKTTMMRIMTGLIPPTTGEVTISGYDALTQSLEIRQNIGYLPEHNPVYPEMYVKEYLQFLAGMYHLGKNTTERIQEIITETGLEPEQHKKIGQLSKGYRQRIGIAQAIIHDPEVLILDEPTTGLDPNQIIEIRNLISKTGNTKTVLLSTHIMQEVEAICDRIIIINNGKIVANDLKENVLSGREDLSNTIVVEFNKDPDHQALQAIEGVDKVARIEANHWLIQYKANQDLRDAVFQFAVKNGLSVLSMQKKEKNLEQVFQELTNQK